MASVFILLGSNEGDKMAVIEKAASLLQELSSRPLISSSLYESEPWGFSADEWFLNQVIKIETEIEATELLHKLLDLEKILGRVRDQSKGDKKIKTYKSRVIDIDILLYGNIICENKELILPHPRMHIRRFALLPLSEIAPDFIHTKYGKSISQLLAECNDTLKVFLLKE